MSTKPENFLEINPFIKEKLDYFVESKKIPHIIFHGSVGTGKRTIVYDFINKIYGEQKQKIKSNVMFVNCAHGKGIKFIREELKFFAKTNIQKNQGVIFKTIVLMNADFLTIDAQSALRRCIELFSYNTRFFIIIENKHRLLKPILSRFCEIHIPEHIDSTTNQVINLHKYNTDIKLSLSEHTASIEEIVKSYFQKIINNMDAVNHKLFSQFADELYEQGISALDIMEFSEKSGIWERSLIVDFKMEFNNIKSEYRCEKLLIFYVLDILFLRLKTT